MKNIKYKIFRKYGFLSKEILSKIIFSVFLDKPIVFESE